MRLIQDPLIRADLFRYFGQVDFQAFRKGLAIPGFRFTFCLRKAAGLPRFSPAGFLYRRLYSRYVKKYNFQIEVATRIGKGFYLGHAGGVIINGQAVIGENCNISHFVTIGRTNRGRWQGCPTIGNRVWIGPGAVVVGNIAVGDNVLIAPNAYVNFDVPADSLVIGNPGKIIPHPRATAGYINHIAP